MDEKSWAFKIILFLFGAAFGFALGYALAIHYCVDTGLRILSFDNVTLSFSDAAKALLQSHIWRVG